MAIDPITTAVAATSKVAGAVDRAQRGAIGELMLKIFGPVAEEYGQQWRDAANQRHRRNQEQVIRLAAFRLGNRIDEIGEIPRRVVHEVLDEGCWSDDGLTLQYLAGLLASSRTGVSRDDRGAMLAALVGRLSSYQIRLHYIIYRTVKDLYNGCGADLTEGPADPLMVFIPRTTLDAAFEWDASEDRESILAHALFGIHREALVDDFAEGAVDMLQRYSPFSRQVTEDGLIAEPTAFGAELFMWAHGVGSGARRLLETDVIVPDDVPIPWVGGSLALASKWITVIGTDRSTDQASEVQVELDLQQAG